MEAFTRPHGAWNQGNGMAIRKAARLWWLWSCIGIVALAGMVLAWRLLSATPVTRTVRVGIYENAPKVYTGKDGQPAGLFIRLLRPIARDEYWSLDFVHCTWDACLKALRAGDIDLMPDVAYSAEREQSLDFHSVALVHGWSEIYARPSLKVRSIADLAGKRVALLREGIQQHYFDELMHGANLRYTPVLVDGYGAGFSAVTEGKADAVVTNNFYSARRDDHAPLVETPILFQPVGLYFATAQGRNGDLLKAIDQHLDAWMSDPDSIYFTALRRSMAPAPIEVVPQWLRWSLLIVLLLALTLVAASLVLRWQVRQRTAALSRTSRHLDEVLRASPAVIYSLREENGALVPDWVSPNILRLYGFRAEQALTANWWREHLHPDDMDRAVARMKVLPAEGSMVHEYRFIDAHGNTRYIRDEMHVTGPREGLPRTVFGTWNDLTESREQAERVDFLTFHDTLTHLPNRLQLMRTLQPAIDEARRRDGVLAVLWIDLDHFKNINETLGHGVGDAFLIHAAEHLNKAIEPGDTLARVGGDEFAVLLARDVGVHHAIAMCERLLAAVAQPITVGDRNLVLGASIGISMYPADGHDAEILLRNAEVAMYEAKNRGRNTWCLFDDQLSARAVERLSMENALRGAIDRGELVLHYQPQIDLTTGQPIGMEALVRWNHPEIGQLPPSEFIGLAEECGVINQIGAWVLGETCRQIVAWRERGLDVPMISVNLSVRQLERGELVSQVARVLEESSLDASSLELELTESMIMRDPEQSTHTLAALKNLGVKLSIDDFGTGHSSLAYLKRLPLDRIKIDRSFVRDIGHNPDDEAICRTVIELARQLGLSTIAEGVEHEAQVRFLRREGCQIAQGFLYSKPLTAEALFAYWTERQPASSTAPD